MCICMYFLSPFSCFMHSKIILLKPKKNKKLRPLNNKIENRERKLERYAFGKGLFVCVHTQCSEKIRQKVFMCIIFPFLFFFFFFRKNIDSQATTKNENSTFSYLIWIINKTKSGKKVSYFIFSVQHSQKALIFLCLFFYFSPNVHFQFCLFQTWAHIFCCFFAFSVISFQMLLYLTLLPLSMLCDTRIVGKFITQNSRCEFQPAKCSLKTHLSKIRGQSTRKNNKRKLKNEIDISRAAIERRKKSGSHFRSSA